MHVHMLSCVVSHGSVSSALPMHFPSLFRLYHLHTIYTLYEFFRSWPAWCAITTGIFRAINFSGPVDAKPSQCRSTSSPPCEFPCGHYLPIHVSAGDRARCRSRPLAPVVPRGQPSSSRTAQFPSHLGTALSAPNLTGQMFHVSSYAQTPGSSSFHREVKASVTALRLEMKQDSDACGLALSARRAIGAAAWCICGIVLIRTTLSLPVNACFE